MGIQFSPDEINFADDDWIIELDAGEFIVRNKSTGRQYVFTPADSSASDSVARIDDISASGGAVSVEEDDSSVVSTVATLNFEDALDVTDEGNSKVTIDAGLAIEDSRTAVTTAREINAGSDLDVTDDGSGVVTFDVGGDVARVNDSETISSTWTFDSTLSLDDQSADPASNGEIQRNGSDVKVYTGGAIKNLSNIGSGGGGGGGADPTANETITGSWDFSATTEFTGGELRIVGNRAEPFILDRTAGADVDHAYAMEAWHDGAGTDYLVIRNHTDDIEILELKENGNVETDNGHFINQGDPVPSSSTGTQYDIQKDGTDGAGIINFKTS